MYNNIVIIQHYVLLKCQFEVKVLYIAFRQIREDEDLVSSLRTKNEKLERELCSLREKVKEHDELNGSRVNAELSALRSEKKRLEERVAGIRNEQLQKSHPVTVEDVTELKAQKTKLEEKLASVSAELDCLQHEASDTVDAELITLRDEKHRLDTLVTFLENEVQRYKDTTHEQRIRALDLTHELREVLCAILFISYMYIYILFDYIATCFNLQKTISRL